MQVADAPDYFRRVWGGVPTTWARTVWLSGHPDTHAMVARRAEAGGAWYLCAVCAAAGCEVDVRGNARLLIGCGRPALVETYLDAGGAGNRSVRVSPPSRVACVCVAEGGPPQMERVELAEGQALLVIIRPENRSEVAPLVPGTRQLEAAAAP